MKKHGFAFVFGLFTLKLAAQLTLNVTSIPINTPAGASIFVAGNFQNWAAGDPNYKLTPGMNGTFSITFTPPVGTVEYKFTRGAWASVEGGANGGFLANRTVNYTGQAKTVDLTILSWEDVGGTAGSTAAWNVSILDPAFFMPQLNKNRRIWLYLPPDYATTTKNYPVLYMHDGQNLFDDATSFSGEWGIDESLNTLHAAGDWGCIVVGIDNGGADRIDEYSPWKNAQYGGGKGEKYADFIVQTLKPYIDSHYRTASDPAHTGTAGSSLGALIANYIGIEHQDVFGKIGNLSPAFWFSDSCFTHVSTTGKTGDIRAYFVAGTNESTTMVPKMTQMRDLFKTIGVPNSELKLKTDNDGAHSEWYWKREFPACYQFLFNNPPTVSTGSPAGFFENLKISPNPASNFIQISGGKSGETWPGKIFATDGRLAKTALFTNDQPVAVDSLSNGNYFLQLFSGEKPVKTLFLSLQR